MLRHLSSALARVFLVWWPSIGVTVTLSSLAMGRASSDRSISGGVAVRRLYSPTAVYTSPTIVSFSRRRDASSSAACAAQSYCARRRWTFRVCVACGISRELHQELITSPSPPRRHESGERCSLVGGASQPMVFGGRLYLERSCSQRSAPQPRRRYIKHEGIIERGIEKKILLMDGG